jgi:hypothetical protein
LLALLKSYLSRASGRTAIFNTVTILPMSKSVTFMSRQTCIRNYRMQHCIHFINNHFIVSVFTLFFDVYDLSSV